MVEAIGELRKLVFFFNVCNWACLVAFSSHDRHRKHLSFFQVLGGLALFDEDFVKCNKGVAQDYLPKVNRSDSDLHRGFDIATNH